MQVILTSRVSNLGQIGDVVNVKNGYARNFLLPQKKAILNNPSNYKIFSEKKKEFEKLNQDVISSANDIKAKISNKDIIIIENSSDDGRLYGSVTTATIAGEVNKITKSKILSRANIILNKPIKEIGVYNILIDLHGDVEITARVVVSRSEAEIAAVIAGNAKKNAKVANDEIAPTEAQQADVVAQEEDTEKSVKKERKPRKSKKEE